MIKRRMKFKLKAFTKATAILVTFIHMATFQVDQEDYFAATRLHFAMGDRDAEGRWFYWLSTCFWKALLISVRWLSSMKGPCCVLANTINTYTPGQIHQVINGLWLHFSRTV